MVIIGLVLSWTEKRCITFYLATFIQIIMKLVAIKYTTGTRRMFGSLCGNFLGEDCDNRQVLDMDLRPCFLWIECKNSNSSHCWIGGRDGRSGWSLGVEPAKLRISIGRGLNVRRTSVQNAQTLVGSAVGHGCRTAMLRQVTLVLGPNIRLTGYPTETPLSVQ